MKKIVLVTITIKINERKLPITMTKIVSVTITIDEKGLPSTLGDFFTSIRALMDRATQLPHTCAGGR